MDYINFQKYPIQILGINESYNEELTAIEEFVISEIDYSGDANDLLPVLPYFVFYKFNEDKESDTTTKGEMATVAEYSIRSFESQRRAWNIGAKMLKTLCTENSQTANEIYQSQISVLW